MKNYIYQTLITQLVSARQKLRLTRTSVSKQLGFPQGYLSRLEHGRYDLRASTLIELSRFYELEVMLVPKKLVHEVRSILQVPIANEDELQRAFIPLGDEDDGE